jgi:hypothetical protein
MTIQHADIPDAQRHEPKGASTATSGQVWVADGAGSGAFSTLGNVITFAVALTPASVGAATTVEQTFTVTGLLTTDKVLNVVKPTHQAGISIGNARVSAANTLAITFVNSTAGSLTPTGPDTYQLYVWRS